MEARPPPPPDMDTRELPEDILKLAMMLLCGVDDDDK